MATLLHFEAPPVYFMHLPRTGGTALGKWLRATYGRRGYVDLKAETLSGVTTLHFRQCSCYHCWHLGKDLFDWLARPDLTCCTLLRHPVERTVSDIYGIQRAALNCAHRFTASYLAELQPWLHATADDCIRSGAMDDLLANAQSRILGNEHDYTLLLQAPRSGLRAPLNAVSWFDFPWLGQAATTSEAEDYGRAATWLKEMAVVGLTERFAESLLLIADLLGIPVPADLPRININPQRSDPAMHYRDQLAPDVVARLEELNRYDLELYACATELFAQQWARYQAQPRRTYSIAPRLRQLLRPLKVPLQRIAAPFWRAPAMRQYMRWFGRRQGLRILWATLFAPDGEVKIHSRQARHPLHLRLRTSDFRIYGQVMARGEYDLPLCRTPKIVVDAGANIGLTAVYFANRFPTARILAIEPEAANFNLLCKNAAAYPQIIPIHAALWDVPTRLELVGTPGLYGAIHVQRTGQPSAMPVLGQVDTVTLTQLMEDFQLDFIDLLKVDIESAEREVFAEAAPWIDQIGVIIVELHDRFQRGCTLSFYAATHRFDLEWHRGEHVIVARRNFIAEYLT
ncbi:FkbM family methyltransferase [Candidatus Chloroploca sp. Khr17]|uniref:FkbM family methyltransferase n=1 Tax=Candidatus Chloroploca sp. Khr17 TaxID=2496869 RepID=UPI00101C3228|nr:FkbM family methyltransferase [Candidatus Chloroploca sp. Khr17]